VGNLVDLALVAGGVWVAVTVGAILVGILLLFKILKLTIVGTLDVHQAG
jgi:hypothetical protein